MKKTKLARVELRRLRRKLERAERRGTIDHPDVRWLKSQVELLDMRVGTMERRLDALQRAAAANPEALREIAMVALAAKVEPP